MYINIIRNYFPAQNFKFGLPYGQAAYNSTVSAWTYNYQNNPWNNYLVIPKKAYIGYDAVIIHMYPGPADSVSMGLANDAYFAAIVPKLTNKLTQEVSVNALNKHAASLPANTEIWLTEWNWSNANYATTNNSLRFNNTMLDLYGKCEFLFAMIDANTFHATKKNLYRVANHHMFNGPLNGSNGSTNYGTVLVNLPYGGALFKRAAYYAFKIMQPVIDNRTGLQYITTTNSGFTNVPSGVKFRAFYKSGGECNYDVGELLLYYSNTSGVDYAVNVNSYLSPMFGSNPSYYVPNGLASNYDAWATKFQASCGASYSTGSEPGNTDAYFVSNPTDATKNIQVMSAPTSLTNTALSNVPIQKYAVGYIRVPIRQQVGFVTCVSKSGNLTTESGGRNGLTIYPNPSNDILNLELASISSGACTIFLYDLTGRLIQAKSIEIESGFNATRLDVSSLLPATYIVKVQFNGTLLAQKIQVIR